MKIKQTKVKITEIPKECQNPIPFDKVYGMSKNMGKVGITYQNVKNA